MVPNRVLLLVGTWNSSFRLILAYGTTIFTGMKLGARLSLHTTPVLGSEVNRI